MKLSGEGSRLRAELEQARRELIALRRENLGLRQQQAADRATITYLRSALQQLSEAYRLQAAPLAEALSELQTLKQSLASTQLQLAEAQRCLAATNLPPRPPSAPKPPGWVKPNRASSEKKPRKPRAAAHNHGRLAQEPTRIEVHKLQSCPNCQDILERHRPKSSRQIIEIPPPQPIEITEHQVEEGWCQNCHKWFAPGLDLSASTLGEGRIGLRLASLIACLRYQSRLPIKLIRVLLKDLWGLELSNGGLIKLLSRLAKATQPAVEALKQQARAGPVVHMDETGWRENGKNGYVWEMATGGETPVVIYHRDTSRSGSVMESLLDGKSGNVLVCDFYSAYNRYTGRIQRCWAHFLRDLHDLGEENPSDESVARWIEPVKKLYREGKDFVEGPGAASEPARQAKYAELVAAARKLGLEYCRAAEHPCHALAQRIMRHIGELFVFVLIEGVPADNNLAERRLRSLVVSRKISGGSRSNKGTETHMTLASLVNTWMAREQNPFVELQTLLEKRATPQTTQLLAPGV